MKETVTDICLDGINNTSRNVYCYFPRHVSQSLISCIRTTLT